MKDEHVETLIWGLLAILVMMVIAAMPARAAVGDRWASVDPELRAWFESLKQPDNPQVSCCGSADSYVAEKIEVRDGRVYATVTDNRGNSLPNGFEVEIPSNKMNRDGNRLGKPLVFLSPGGVVYCFLNAGGV